MNATRRMRPTPPPPGDETRALDALEVAAGNLQYAIGRAKAVVERLQSEHVATELTADVLGEMENIDPGELIEMVRQLKRALDTQQT